MLKLTNLALCALSLLPNAAIAQTSPPSAAQPQTGSDHHADEAAIEQVMKQYHAAILAHDGTALSGLFLPDANLWLNVLTDSAYAGCRQSRQPPRKFVSAAIRTSRSWSPRHPKPSTRNTATS